MSMIYSFLQKKKMRENHYGILMVIIAYVLSFVLLVLGSDSFYNIHSRAAGTNIKSIEATKNLSDEPVKQRIFNSSSDHLKEKLINPYGFMGAYGVRENVLSKKEIRGDALAKATLTNYTYWLLDQELENGIYDLQNLQIRNIETDTRESEKTIAKKEKSKKSKGKSTDVIESFSVDDKTETTVMSVTKEEKKMLERIVEAEATGEDMIGKILIANVIFNRMEDKNFPDTIKEVIFQNSNGDYQFSPVSDERFWKVKITEETEEAVERALQGEDYSEGALYFMARKRTNKANWFDQHLKWLFKHGGHEFYKNK